MAFLGLSLTVTSMVIFIMIRLRNILKLASRCVANLVFYTIPTDDTIRQQGITLQSLQQNTDAMLSSRKRQNQSTRPLDYTVAKSAPITLKLNVVELKDRGLAQLPMFLQADFLVVLTLAAMIISVLAEFSFRFFQPDPINTFNWPSVFYVILGCLAVMCLSTVLLSNAVVYNRLLALLIGFVCFLLASGVLMQDEHLFTFGLDQSLNALLELSRASLTNLLGEDSAVFAIFPSNYVRYKVYIAICSGIFACLFSYPGLRFGDSYHEALKLASENFLVRSLLHINFVFPLFISLSFGSPLVRALESELGLTEAQIHIYRVYAVVILVLFRLYMIRPLLQGFLNTAFRRLRAIQKEPGRVETETLRLRIGYVMKFIFIAIIQYVGPLTLILCSALLLKQSGGLRWVSEELDAIQQAAPVKPIDPTSNLHAIVFRGLFSYCIWWLSTCLFITSGIGKLYSSSSDRVNFVEF